MMLGLKQVELGCWDLWSVFRALPVGLPVACVLGLQLHSGQRGSRE